MSPSKPRAITGRVTLVGAGPGDPDLLTIAAVKAIAAADVILVDDLVDPAVLEHASPSAHIVNVGKRGPYCRAGTNAGGDALRGKSRPSTPQAFIERLMLVEARRGRHVVRLKGGDPYVFGRGGEERAHLMAAGVDVRVVPGISSGIAGPASIGVPVTHRDWSQGVIFVTGHRKRAQAGAGGDGDDASAAPDLDWKAIASTGLTVVIYMGLGRCRELVDAMIAAGMRADLPAAAVQSASTDGQRQVVTTLAALPDAVRAAGIGSPAILVIGDVVRCADRQWLEAGESDAAPMPRLLAG